MNGDKETSYPLAWNKLFLDAAPGTAFHANLCCRRIPNVASALPFLSLWLMEATSKHQGAEAWLQNRSCSFCCSTHDQRRKAEQSDRRKLQYNTDCTRVLRQAPMRKERWCWRHIKPLSLTGGQDVKCSFNKLYNQKIYKSTWLLNYHCAFSLHEKLLAPGYAAEEPWSF